jgi:hypothetical protein
MTRHGERMVTLHDGTEVSNYSEEWRHECEARAILAMPRKSQRQDYLWGSLDERGKPRGGVLQIRGEDAVRRLEETILALWEKRKQMEAA